MKITFDTREYLNLENYDFLGEFFRNKCFIPKDSFGCYSTFELTSDFKKVEYDSELGKKLLKFLHNTENEWEHIKEIEEIYPLQEFIEDYKPSLYSNGEINIAWYWDGDGTLLFDIEEFTIINNDCKKDHGWCLIDQ